jgi:CBS domain-containing protein
MFPITDVMTKDVATTTSDTPILAAAQILVDRRISGLPVVDAENNLVGILSEFDMLRLLTETSSDLGRVVGDFMSKRVISFEDTSSAVEVCDFFLKNPNKRRVPITHHGKLVGLVSRGDIVKYIVKIRYHKT